MWLVVLVVDDLCFCFRFCSLHLICRASLMVLQDKVRAGGLCCTTHTSYRIHIHWRSTLDVHLGHAPWTCTLHVPWTCTSAPWMPRAIPCATLGLHAAPWTDTLESTLPRTPLDPCYLEMPARKGKGAVGRAGLGAGRAPVGGPLAGFNHCGWLAVPGPQCRHPGWCLPRPIAWPVPTGSPHAAQLPVEEDAAVTRMPCARSLPQGGRHCIIPYDIPYNCFLLSLTMHRTLAHSLLMLVRAPTGAFWATSPSLFSAIVLSLGSHPRLTYPVL